MVWICRSSPSTVSVISAPLSGSDVKCLRPKPTIVHPYFFKRDFSVPYTIISGQDGYRMAEPEFFHDQRPDSDTGTEALEDMKRAANKAIADVEKMRQRL